MIRHPSLWFISALTLLLHGCAQFPMRPMGLEPSNALADPRTTTWGYQFSQLGAARDGLSGFHVLQSGVDGIAARIQIIRRSERTLDLQYFIYRSDTSGTLITEELRRAADRGVRVRVLVDDGDTVSGDERILELDGFREMQVRVFNPFNYRGHNRLLRNLDFVLHKSRLDHRMHNKLMVADNAVALVGGRNVGDQYFQIDPASQFADDDVFTVGAAVPTLSKSFDEFWNSDLVVPASELITAKRSSAHLAAPTSLASGFVSRIESGEPLNSLISDPGQLTWAGGKVLYDSPNKELVRKRQQRGRLMSEAVEREIEQASSDVVIVSPYFVPSEHELELLESARGRSSQVRILTNSMESTPEVAAHSGYQKVRIPLLKAGAQVFEVRARLDTAQGSGQGRRISQYGNYALHGKMYVFDSRRVLLGSWNYDQRSLRINTEIGLLIDSGPVAREVIHRFEAMVSPQAAYKVVLVQSTRGHSSLVWETETDHHRQTLRAEPSRGYWRRIKSRLLALLPLEHEL